MTFAEFLAAYWWLMFPIFGMVMAVLGMGQSERLTRSTLETIKSYVDQGKEPPPELLRRAAHGLQEGGVEDPKSGSSGWTPVVFTALTAAAAVGYFNTEDTDLQWALMVAGVAMGVMAIGSLLIFFFRKR